MTIIRITAMWCTSCLLMKKRWKTVFAQFPEIQIKDIDYDFDSEEALKLEVGKILPVLILYDDDGNELSRVIGEKTVKELHDILTGMKT